MTIPTESEVQRWLAGARLKALQFAEEQAQTLINPEDREPYIRRTMEVFNESLPAMEAELRKWQCNRVH